MIFSMTNKQRSQNHQWNNSTALTCLTSMKGITNYLIQNIETCILSLSLRTFTSVHPLEKTKYMNGQMDFTHHTFGKPISVFEHMQDQSYLSITTFSYPQSTHLILNLLKVLTAISRTELLQNYFPQ
jgi:hypothetical protein